MRNPVGSGFYRYSQRIERMGGAAEMNHYLVVMFNLNIPTGSLSEAHPSSRAPSSPRVEKCRSLKEAQDLAERYKDRFERIRIYSLEKKISVIEEFLYGTRYLFQDLDSSDA